MDNPYNKVYPSDPQYSEAQYFIMCIVDTGPHFPTMAAFLTYEDAKRICDTFHPCYKARVLKVCDPE